MKATSSRDDVCISHDQRYRATEPMITEVKANPKLEIVAQPQEIPFNGQGNLVMKWPPRWAD